jgi:hypothetical protein
MFCHPYQRIVVIFFMFLLSSCASIQGNYYNQTIDSWDGANVSTLLKTWGKPDKKLNTLSGSTVYVYKKQENRRPNNATKKVDVKYKPAGTSAITAHKTRWNNGMTLFCIVAFEVNNQGTIIDTQTQGNNCFADMAFMQAMKNPARR